MPELPEIEALRETLDARLVGRTITGVQARQFALVKTYDPQVDALVGQSFTGSGRHGKHLLLEVGADYTVAIHLGIGGRIVLVEAGRKPSKAVSMEIRVDDGTTIQIVELGTKKRSSVHVLRRADVAQHLAPLGVDALSPDLTPARLGELLESERSQLKRFLTDQHRVAGIGNAYSDEILWEACLAPLKVTTSLDAEETERLHAAIGAVFTRAMEGARDGNYLLVARGDKRGDFRAHRREGEPCPRCGEMIASIHFAESSLQYCPQCQVEGRRYADRRLSRLLK